MARPFEGRAFSFRRLTPPGWKQLRLSMSLAMNRFQLDYLIDLTTEALLPSPAPDTWTEPPTSPVDSPAPESSEPRPPTADEAIAAAWRRRRAKWRAEPRHELRRRPEGTTDDDIVDAEVVEDVVRGPEPRAPLSLPHPDVRALPPGSPEDPLTQSLRGGIHREQ